jgi:predicted phosphodiesterase
VRAGTATAQEVVMLRHILRSLAISLACVWLLGCPARDQTGLSEQTGIPERIGDWSVEVGPPGNDFYEAPAPATRAAPPSQAMFDLVKRIAPAHTEVKRWEFQNGERYFIRSEAEHEEYDFLLSTDGQLMELEYENDLASIDEQPGDLIIRGTRKSVSVEEVPEKTTRLLRELYPDASPGETWQVSTAAGARFAIVVGERAFFCRPDGQIQAIGLVDEGALNEVDPPIERSPEEIRADAVERLGPYRERFDIQRQIKQLGSQPSSPDGTYRFVAMGDSRSNPDLWPKIVKHISLLDPKPAFIIHSGDLVRHGYTDEYLDYFIPPLMETDIPFFVALGNHDDGDDGLAVEYQTLFGPNSLNYSFDYGRRRFVMIDNVTKVLPDDETLAWLKQVLEETPPERSVIVAAHEPVALIEKWAYHSWDEEPSKVFADLMSEHEVEHVFFGHIHAYSTARHQGVDYTLTGGGGAPLHDRFGPTGNVHNYVICDVQPDGSIRQQVVRFRRTDAVTSSPRDRAPRTARAQAATGPALQ